MMKKKQGKTLLIITVLLLFVGFTALSACSSEPIAQKSGTVTDVTGEARVHRNGGSLPAYKGLTLRHGDVIKTEKESTAAITVDGNKHLLIEPESSVALSLYENDVRVELTSGAVYVEDDASGAADRAFRTETSDAVILGGESAYRVVCVSSENGYTSVQSLKGNAQVMLSNSKEEKQSPEAGHECLIERRASKNGYEPYFAVRDKKTDPYELPDRYIELGAEGVFDQSGALIPKQPSSDFSLRGITLSDAEGREIQLLPEFDNSIPGYVAEAPLSNSTLTVTANHKKTTVRVSCHTASAIEENGRIATISLPSNVKYHAVSILVIAENGDEIRFSVNIIPPESK